MVVIHCTILKGVSTLVQLCHSESESAARVGIILMIKRNGDCVRSKCGLIGDIMWVLMANPFRMWNSYFMKLRHKAMFLKSRNSEGKHANGNSWNSLNTGNFNWSDFNSLTPCGKKTKGGKQHLTANMWNNYEVPKWNRPLLDQWPRDRTSVASFGVENGGI